MKRISQTHIFLTLLIVMGFALFSVAPAFAADAVEIEFSGKVTAVAADSLTVETSEGHSFVVKSSDPAFDYTAFAADDMVEVEGILNADGTVSAEKLVLEGAEPIEIKFTGTVTAEDATTLTVKVNDTTTFVVTAPEGFDFETVAVDDMVKVKGTLNEDGTVTAHEIEVIEEDGEVKIEFTGTVKAINGDGSITVETEDGRTFIVFLPEDFDTEGLLDQVVKVKGFLEVDGTVTAFAVKSDDDDDDEDGEDKQDGFYCRQSEVQHPFGARLAERYDVEYEMLQEWFCDGFGWGQIMLALHTAEVKDGDTPLDPAALLEQRKEGEGWGQIWKGLGLIGKDRDGNAPNDEDHNGKPDKQGKPENPGKSDKSNRPNK